MMFVVNIRPRATHVYIISMHTIAAVSGLWFMKADPRRRKRLLSSARPRPPKNPPPAILALTQTNPPVDAPLCSTTLFIALASPFSSLAYLAYVLQDASRSPRFAPWEYAPPRIIPSVLGSPRGDTSPKVTIMGRAGSFL